MKSLKSEAKSAQGMYREHRKRQSAKNAAASAIMKYNKALDNKDENKEIVK